MEDKLLEIINHYGVMKQLKYFQSEVFELNEAIIKDNTLDGIVSPIQSTEHIAEEIADVLVMLNQFKEYYGITDNQIEEIMQSKVYRQLDRIKEEI